MSNNHKIIAITGPTATGKTALAVKLAEKFNGEIISVDSRQVYKFMDLGTGKDLSEYGTTPYHLIDIAHPKETFNLFDFLEMVKIAMQDIFERNKLPILCGGTPLYLNAILQKYQLSKVDENEELRATLDNMSLDELIDYLKQLSLDSFLALNSDDQINKLRIRRQIELISLQKSQSYSPWPEFDALVLGVQYSREVVRNRVEIRLKERLANKMIDEVKFLHEEENISYEKLERFGLEYREIAKFLQHQVTYEEMYSTLLNKIRQFVKRQDIFFRKMEREGVKINWVPRGNIDSCSTLIKNFLEG